MNERLLRDGCEALALVGGLPGDPSSQPVQLWLEFIATPTPSCWYRAHNASIVSGYLEHEGLAERENAPERFFINVALVRVLYAHALVAAPGMALGRLSPVGRVLGDPRLGLAGAFLSLRRVIPNHYPLVRDVEWYIGDEQRLGRLLDYAVIAPRLQGLYEWSAQELDEPRLLALTATRSTSGHSRIDMCGTPSACPSRLRYSSTSLGLAEVDAAPKAGQALFELENRELLCQPTVRALRARQTREQRAGCPRFDDLGWPDGEGAPRTDHVTTVAQVPKPIRFLAVQERDHESPASPERKERRAVLPAGTSTAVEDDRPRWDEPGVQPLNTVGDPLVKRATPRESFISDPLPDARAARGPARRARRSRCRRSGSASRGRDGSQVRSSAASGDSGTRAGQVSHLR